MLDRLGFAGRQIRRLASSRDGLVFLVCATTSLEKCELIETGLRLNDPFAVPLGTPDEVFDVAGDRANGRVAALLTPVGNGPTHIKSYDAAGSVLGDVSVAKNLTTIAFVSSSLYSLGTLGEIRLLSGTTSNVIGSIGPDPIPEDHYYDSDLLAVTATHPAVLHRSAATIVPVDIRQLSERSPFSGKAAMLADPFLTSAKQSYANASAGLRGSPIIATTSDANSRIYCLLSGFRAPDGAPVLVFDESGIVTTRFRVSVINVVRGKPEWEVPMAIAVNSGSLYVLFASNRLSVFVLREVGAR